MLQSRVKFKFKDSNRWTNEERPSVEELISIKNHESLTKGDQGFMYNLLCSFRIYNFHNNLITFRNEVFSLLLAWEIAWAVLSQKWSIGRPLPSQANVSSLWKENTGRWAAAFKICAAWLGCRDRWTKRIRRRPFPIEESLKSRLGNVAATMEAALSWPCRIWRRKGHRLKYLRAWLRLG